MLIIQIVLGIVLAAIVLVVIEGVFNENENHGCLLIIIVLVVLVALVVIF